MGQAFKKHPKLVFAVSTVWDGLPKNIPNRFLLCPLYRVQFTVLIFSYISFLTHRRFFISSYIFLVIHRRFFTKFISSHMVLGIHGRSFLYNGVLPYEILIHRELFLHNYFLLHRLFNFPDAPSQKNSSIPYFPYIGQRAKKLKASGHE